MECAEIVAKVVASRPGGEIAHVALLECRRRHAIETSAQANIFDIEADACCRPPP